MSCASFGTRRARPLVRSGGHRRNTDAMMFEVEGSKALISEGRNALERGDAASARTAFEGALAERTCGDTLAGLAEALFLERDYATCRGLFERAHAAYRQEHNPLGAYHAGRMVARFYGGLDGEWAIYNGWTGRARSVLEEQLKTSLSGDGSNSSRRPCRGSVRRDGRLFRARL